LMLTAGQLDSVLELLRDGSGVNGSTPTSRPGPTNSERCGCFSKTSAICTGRKKVVLVAAI